MLSFSDYGVGVNSTSLVLVTLVTLVGAWMWSQQRPRKDFPPGPKGWPVIGNLIEFTSKPASELFREYTKEYGNIFSIRLGQRWTVVLNGAAVIKEALLTKGAAFANRPITFTADVMSDGGQDISFGQISPRWTLHRKLVHSALRTLATGNNNRLEKLVYSVLPSLTELLDSKGTEPFDPRATLAPVVLNIIATLCFGKKYGLESPNIKTWMHVNKRGAELTRNGILADYIDIFKYIPSPAKREMKALYAAYYQLMDEEMEQHRVQYDAAKEPSSVVDLLFHARQEILEEGKEDVDSITETHLKHAMGDVFGGGVDGSLFTIVWSVGLMVQHPEVQKEVAEELDEVVGRERIPSLSDRDKLPYTVAVLYEIMRYSTITPMSLPHATSREVSIGGYTIPEGVWVLVNMHSMHFDEELWDKPRTFNPEHFLDENGQVRHHTEGFITFSAGRRVCLGEAVAKAELFLLFSWLFQHYQFSKVPGTEGQDYSLGIEAASGHILKDIKVVVKRRF